MTRMYQDCHLIHADLSEYNLLWHQNRLHVIDVSQAVEPWHPEAMEFLQRDARNIVNFFRKAGVKKVLSIREVMSQVTGIDVDEDLTDNEFLKQVRCCRHVAFCGATFLNICCYNLAKVDGDY